MWPRAFKQTRHRRKRFRPIHSPKPLPRPKTKPLCLPRRECHLPCPALSAVLQPSPAPTISRCTNRRPKPIHRLLPRLCLPRFKAPNRRSNRLLPNVPRGLKSRGPSPFSPVCSRLESWPSPREENSAHGARIRLKTTRSKRSSTRPARRCAEGLGMLLPMPM